MVNGKNTTSNKPMIIKSGNNERYSSLEHDIAGAEMIYESVTP